MWLYENIPLHFNKIPLKVSCYFKTIMNSFLSDTGRVNTHKHCHSLSEVPSDVNRGSHREKSNKTFLNYVSGNTALLSRRREVGDKYINI